MKRRTLFALSLSAPLLLATLPQSAAAWDWGWGSGQRVQGSGKVVDDRRALGNFSRIRVDDSFDVVARQSGQTAATVHADDNLQALLQTTIEGDTLIIKTKPGYALRGSGPIKITVDFTQLRAADLRGSGDLTVDGIKGDSLEVALAGSGNLKVKGADLGRLSSSLSGSGDIDLQGKAQEFKGSIAGSGDIHATDLSARQVSINIAGSGDAKVFASEALTVSIAGSGDVSYAGSPAKVNTQVAGSGSIRTLR